MSTLRLSPIVGYISDHIGRKKIFIFTSIVTFAMGIVTALMSDFITVGMIILSLGLIMSGFCIVDLNMTELFPTHVRASGTGTAYSLGVMIFIGLQPNAFHFLGTQLGLGTWNALGALLMVTSLMTLTGSFNLSSTIHKEAL